MCSSQGLLERALHKMVLSEASKLEIRLLKWIEEHPDKEPVLRYTIGCGEAEIVEGCQHQWTDSMVIQGENGAKVFVCCSVCDKQMKLSNFLREKQNGL